MARDGARAAADPVVRVPLADEKLGVLEAVQRIRSEMSAVGKTEKNKDQGWEFRSIEAVVDMLEPLLTRYGVLLVPREVSHERLLEPGTKDRTLATVIVRMEWTIYAVGGGGLPGLSGKPTAVLTIGPITGESSDYGDKATAQAQTMARKTMLSQVFDIPFGTPDPDSNTVERGSAAPPRGKRAEARKPWAEGGPQPAWAAGWADHAEYQTAMGQLAEAAPKGAQRDALKQRFSEMGLDWATWEMSRPQWERLIVQFEPAGWEKSQGPSET